MEMGSPRGGRRPRGKGLPCPPRQGETPPPPRVPNPRRMGGRPKVAPQPIRAGFPPLSAHGALRDRWPHPVDPRDPSGGPGTIPVTPRYSGKIPISPGTLPISKYRLSIYQYSCLDHLETPRHVHDHIRDSEQHSVTKSYNSYNTISLTNVKRNSYNTISSTNVKHADPTGLRTM